VNQDT